MLDAGCRFIFSNLKTEHWISLHFLILILIGFPSRRDYDYESYMGCTRRETRVSTEGCSGRPSLPAHLNRRRVGTALVTRSSQPKESRSGTRCALISTEGGSGRPSLPAWAYSKNSLTPSISILKWLVKSTSHAASRAYPRLLQICIRNQRTRVLRPCVRCF